MDLGLGEFALLRRHLVDLAIVDHRHDGVFTPAVQPDIVGEVRRTDGLIAFAVNPVAGGASAPNDRLR